MAISIVATAGGAMMTLATPQIVSADCNSGFLGFPAWYRGLTKDPDCSIKSPSEVRPGGLTSFIWTIGLNLVEIILVAVAYLSGFYFLYGGFLFIVSQGKPDGAAKARMTMLQALVGLIIGLVSMTIVNFIVDGIMK